MSETPTTSRQRILEIEEAAFRAWPALRFEEVAGWRLRAAEGVTGRANSVWAMQHDGSMSVADTVAVAERFYVALGLPPRFQINAGAQPEGLDSLLDRRGYRLASPTLVQTAALRDVMAKTPSLRSRPEFEVEVSEAFDDEWFALYRSAEGMDEHTATIRASILHQAPTPCGFVRLRLHGEAAAIGLGVVHGRWLGIFCMETLDKFRRRGAATAILRTLAIWAQMYGAEEAYLQVTAPNSGAQALYGRIGFRTEYPYYYRILERSAHAANQDAPSMRSAA